MRRLGAVGITTQEACGNSVRNVTACPRAGCCQEETFDVTPHAKALTYFFLGHHDVQDFGRKFKIAFSGCKHNGCGLTGLHDLGLIAKTQTVDGKEQRGFEFYVGGGLGAVPHQAKKLFDFLPEEELLPMSQAVCRVFARLGEKKNRARARVKFLVAKLGDEEFKKLVLEERKIMPEDSRWTDYLGNLDGYYSEGPLKDPGSLNGHRPAGFDAFLKHNVYSQKQDGYSIVTVKLPLGDITAAQLRSVADISRKYLKETVRTTVEQNLVLRWVSQADLPAIYEELAAVGLAEAGAEGITDLVACPVMDTCKLGISASRGLVGELRKRFLSGDLETDEVIERLKIKVSGCFNSCSQHHVADLGFYGVARKVGNHTVPHFQVVLGGQWTNNAGSYGLPILAVPSKRIPDVVRRMATRYRDERDTSGGQPETFQAFIKRIGKAKIKEMLMDLTEVPAYEADRSLYSDWRDPREYTTGDMGIGECAGEVVSRIDMDLAAAERELFEAQVALDSGEFQKAGEMAYMSMMHGAKGLVKLSWLDVPEDPQVISEQFRKKFYETKYFFDPYAGGKFAHYYFSAHEAVPEKFTEETAHHRVEEAGLFIEAAHSCNARMGDEAIANLTAAVI